MHASLAKEVVAKYSLKGLVADAGSSRKLNSLGDGLFAVPFAAPSLDSELHDFEFSPSGLREALGAGWGTRNGRIEILHMNCAGCEYALADYILCTGRFSATCDRDFFLKVQQFVLEISFDLATSQQHWHNLALLFWQVEAAGLQLVHSSSSVCTAAGKQPSQDVKCPSEPVEIARLCAASLRCHTLLFARIRKNRVDPWRAYKKAQLTSEPTDAQALQALSAMGQTLRDMKCEYQERVYGVDYRKCWDPKQWESCKPASSGKGWGEHSLCKSLLDGEKQCRFMSYGISNDYSFDSHLVKTYGCKGLLMDPTVEYPWKLGPSMRFVRVAAPAMYAPQSDWIEMSPVGLLRSMGADGRLDVLKMDCEGCEYTIADYVLCKGRFAHACDRNFFHKVDQFALEVHTMDSMLLTERHGLNLGKLFWLLNEAGLSIIHSHYLSCGEVPPKCPDILRKAGYPCVGAEGQCHNYLFARTKTK
eukprot:TRINITY_DN23557_c0_g1_i1.p1 TRINITY_DN23557_c0_g1~~TRINITY_DN23557_c0_g1_i1.p1  ORF type:complete len:475 (-),score=60.37 TRINITY_DN23557_c0_g1_i1:389-1813(-)